MSPLYNLINDSTGKSYKKVSDGTCYYPDTSDEIIKLLEQIRKDNIRCRFHWGNTETGRDWGDTYDVTGTIGRSTGPIKVPLLIYNSRSTGGEGILTHCIVKIMTTRGKKVLYQHSQYHISLKDQIQKAFNLPEENFSNHCSNLLILYSPEVMDWLKENYDSFQSIKVSQSDIKDQDWYKKQYIEIPFAYEEYHEK